MTLERVVKALYDYTAQEDDELTFSEDDVLAVLPSENEDWLSAHKLNGSETKQGLIPSNYVEDLEVVGMMQVAFSYSAQDDLELDLQEGQFVYVMAKDVQPQWHLIKLAGEGSAFGLAPSNYLQEPKASKAENDLKLVHSWSVSGGKFGITCDNHAAYVKNDNSVAFCEPVSKIASYDGRELQFVDGKRHSIILPEELMFARMWASYDFVPRGDEELAVKKDQAVLVFTQDSDWSLVATNAKVGRVPTEYLSTVAAASKPIDQLRRAMSSSSLKDTSLVTPPSETMVIDSPLSLKNNCPPSPLPKLDQLAVQHKKSKPQQPAYAAIEDKPPALPPRPSLPQISSPMRPNLIAPPPPKPSTSPANASSSADLVNYDAKMQLAPNSLSQLARSLSQETLNRPSSPKILVIKDGNRAVASPPVQSEAAIIRSNPLATDLQQKNSTIVKKKALPERPQETANDKPNPRDTRLWNDKTGRFQVEAQFLGLQSGQVKLWKLNGKTIMVPLEQLSETDVQFVYGKESIPHDPNAKLSEPYANNGSVEWMACLIALGVDRESAKKYAQTLIADGVSPGDFAPLTRDYMQRMAFAESHVILILRAKPNHSQTTSIAHQKPSSAVGVTQPVVPKQIPPPSKANQIAVKPDSVNNAVGPSQAIAAEADNGQFDRQFPEARAILAAAQADQELRDKQRQIVVAKEPKKPATRALKTTIVQPKVDQRSASLDELLTTNQPKSPQPHQIVVHQHAPPPAHQPQQIIVHQHAPPAQPIPPQQPIIIQQVTQPQQPAMYYAAQPPPPPPLPQMALFGTPGPLFYQAPPPPPQPQIHHNVYVTRYSSSNSSQSSHGAMGPQNVHFPAFSPFQQQPQYQQPAFYGQPQYQQPQPPFYPSYYQQQYPPR